MRPKVVFDTNIFISALIFGGNPRSCLELAKSREIDLYTSRAILFELVQKLKKKFGWRDEETTDAIEGLAKFIKVVEPQEKLTLIKNDPTDNKILECAKEAKADFIVSGDIRHILVLKKFGKAKIIKAKDFLDEFYKQ